MKSLISCLLFIGAVTFTQNSFGQIKQGSFRVGGSIGYSNGKFENDFKYRLLSLRPSVAYFPISNFSIGLTTALAHQKGDFTTSTYTIGEYSLGPELRYYFPFGKWAVFPEVVYTFGKTITKSTAKVVTGDPITDTDYEAKFSAFRFGAGISYFINSNVGVEGLIYYKNTDEDASSPFSSPSKEKTINLNIGLQIYLNRK